MRKVISLLLTFTMVFTCFTAIFTVDAYTVDTTGPLYKKSVLFVGDSITYAQVERTANLELIGWPGRIMAWNDMTGTNGGISGASYSTCRPSNRIITQLKGQAGKFKQLLDYDFRG